MATWIAHLRVAEKLLERLENIDVRAFLVGNIGPDAGVPNEDYSAFTPPQNLTHWYDESKNIDTEDFRDKYLKEVSSCTIDAKSFYLGYYVHLLCDVEWSKLYREKKEEPLYREGLEKDPKFVWVIKKDWYGQDDVYLRDNKDCIFFREFIKIKEFPNKYLDFFPADAFTSKVNYISKEYLGSQENLDREFIYLSKAEMDSYVENAAKVAADRIAELGIL